MDPYTDEKWKLSKKGSRSIRSSSRREHSSSTTAPSTSAAAAGSAAHLKRSSSMPESVKATRHRPSSPSSRSSFTGRCANVVKEQRARFYIMRRCVNMLMCWRDYP